MRVEQLDKFIQELECSPDEKSREPILQAVGVVLEFHRSAVQRLLEILRQQGLEALIHRFPEVEPKAGELFKVLLFEEEVLVCTVDRRAFALKNRCPAEHQNPAHARLEGLFLRCPCHGYRFDVRSGRGVETPGLELDVVPVTLEEGMIKVGL